MSHTGRQEKKKKNSLKRLNIRTRVRCGEITVIIKPSAIERKKERK